MIMLLRVEFCSVLRRIAEKGVKKVVKSVRQEMEEAVVKLAGVEPDKAEVIVSRMCEILLRASGKPDYQSVIWRVLTGE